MVGPAPSGDGEAPGDGAALGGPHSGPPRKRCRRGPFRCAASKASAVEEGLPAAAELPPKAAPPTWYPAAEAAAAATRKRGGDLRRKRPTQAPREEARGQPAASVSAVGTASVAKKCRGVPPKFSPRSLRRDGAVTVRVCSFAEAVSLGAALVAACCEFPEFLPGARYPALGGFGALGTPSSFHHPLVRRCRALCLPAAAALFRQYIRSGENQGSGGVSLGGRLKARRSGGCTDRASCPSGGATSGRGDEPGAVREPARDSGGAGGIGQVRLELLWDRLCWRRKGTMISSETMHRDVAEFALPGDEIFGGWLNLDSAPQYFQAVPGSQHHRAHGGTGFCRERKDATTGAGMRRIEVPPGNLLVFYQKILHEIPGQKISRDSLRLFVGWRLTRSAASLQDVAARGREGVPDTEAVIRTQAVPLLPSGQQIPMYAKSHLLFWPLRLKQWSDANIRDNCKEWVTMGPGRSIRLVVRHLSSLERLGVPLYRPYSEEELSIMRPTDKWVIDGHPLSLYCDSVSHCSGGGIRGDDAAAEIQSKVPIVESPRMVPASRHMHRGGQIGKDKLSPAMFPFRSATEKAPELRCSASRLHTGADPCRPRFTRGEANRGTKQEVDAVVRLLVEEGLLEKTEVDAIFRRGKFARKLLRKLIKEECVRKCRGAPLLAVEDDQGNGNAWSQNGGNPIRANGDNGDRGDANDAQHYSVECDTTMSDQEASSAPATAFPARGLDASLIQSVRRHGKSKSWLVNWPSRSLCHRICTVKDKLLAEKILAACRANAAMSTTEIKELSKAVRRDWWATQKEETMPAPVVAPALLAAAADETLPSSPFVIDLPGVTEELSINHVLVDQLER